MRLQTSVVECFEKTATMGDLLRPPCSTAGTHRSGTGTPWSPADHAGVAPQGRGLHFAVSPRPSSPLAPAVPLLPSSSPLLLCPSHLKQFHLPVLTLLASVPGFQMISRSWPRAHGPDHPSQCSRWRGAGPPASSGPLASRTALAGGGRRAHRTCSLSPGRPG